MRDINEVRNSIVGFYRSIGIDQPSGTDTIPNLAVALERSEFDKQVNKASKKTLRAQFIVFNDDVLENLPTNRSLFDVLASDQYIVLPRNGEWLIFDNKHQKLSETGYADLVELLSVFASVKQNENPDGDKMESAVKFPKPFLILAGPSGTGKSRWVRKQAYRYWPQLLENTDAEVSPPNYQLISVRPNWHDSSEVLGYISRVSGVRYVLTDFVRFLIKAWRQWHVELNHEKRRETPTPFFLCLDEMNLAPVEQYFAEYLSVVETRRVANKNVFGDELPVESYVVSDPLLSASEFKKLIQIENECDDGKQKPWSALCSELDIDALHPVMSMLKNHGLSLPPNLYVVGTVNMDETTHSFSCKVLDRAFVWEMPIGDLSLASTLNGSDKLQYQNEVVKLPRYTEAYQVYDKLGGNADGAIAQKLLIFLNRVNEKLADTPFQVSYRVRDELLLLAHSREVKTDEELWACLDDGLYAKVLPRIEGDEARTRKALVGLMDLLNNDLPEDWLSLIEDFRNGNPSDENVAKTMVSSAFLEKRDQSDPFSPVKPWRRSLAKLRSMLLKLEGQFTNYWD